jgi:hypothetical protein
MALADMLAKKVKVKKEAASDGDMGDDPEVKGASLDDVKDSAVGDLMSGLGVEGDTGKVKAALSDFIKAHLKSEAKEEATDPEK